MMRSTQCVRRSPRTAELLKDADLLQHYLYNPGVELDGAKSGRVQAILTELRLDGQGNCIEESA